MKSKKLFGILLAGLIAGSMVTGCADKETDGTKTDGTKSDSTKSDETKKDDTKSDSTEKPAEKAKKLTFVTNGDKTDRMKEYQKTVEKYAQDHGINVTIDLQVIPWSESPAVKLASGEEFATGASFEYIGKGYVQDLTDVVNEYGKTLKEKIEQTSFDAFTKDGRLWAIPLGNKNNASECYGAFEVRQDLLEEAGMTEIKTIEDLEAFYDACKPLHPDYLGFSGKNNVPQLLSRSVSDKVMLFIDYMYLFVDNAADDDKVYSYFESEEFKKTCEITRRWNQKGIIAANVLSDPNSVLSAFMGGQGMFRAGTGCRVWEDTDTVVSNNPDARLKIYMTGMDTPKVSRGNYSMAFMVSANVKNPEDYVKFFDLIYENQESYDFFHYGEEGVDYTLNDNGRVTPLTPGGLFFDKWITAHSDYMRFSTNITDEQIDDYKHWNDGAVPQKDIGFVFNSEPVKDVMAQLNSVYNEYCVPMLLGFTDYESGYDELLKQLKKAGIDDYVAEYQKQFSEFYNNK